MQGLFSCVSYISKPLSGSVSPNQSTTEFFVGLSFVLVFLVGWVVFLDKVGASPIAVVLGHQGLCLQGVHQVE